MEPSDVSRAVSAALATASALGLPASDAVVVNNSDRIAMRLLPCDVLARVAPAAWEEGMAYEMEVARRLADSGSPVGELEPRVPAEVYVRDGFSITLWTYYESVVGAGVASEQQLGWSSALSVADYVDALVRIHAGLRRIEVAAPHISVRVDGWTASAEDRESTPDLSDGDRELICSTLRRVGAAVSAWGAPEQLLHGEPHPGNVLSTRKGPLFIDVGTCQRGPVEYDLSYAPDEVAALYPGVDQELVQQFRILMWAGVAAMRWGRDDQFPDRERWRVETLDQLRAALAR